MKKALVAGLLSVILLLPGTTVQAGGYYYGHGRHPNGHGCDFLIAAGIVGGGIFSGSVASPPTDLAQRGVLESYARDP